MPNVVSLTDGQPYINALGSLATRTGNWLTFGDGLDTLAFDWEFALGAGNVTGSINVQYAAQLNGTMPSTGTRILLPLGSLHTTLTSASLASAPNPSDSVTLTAVTTGRLLITLAALPAGNYRCVYVFGSGTGASPNTVTCYATGVRR